MKITIDIDLSLDNVKEFGKKIANSKQATVLKQAFINTYEACLDPDTRKFSAAKCADNVKTGAKKGAEKVKSAANSEKVRNAREKAVKYAGVAKDKATTAAVLAKDKAVKCASTAREKVEKGVASVKTKAKESDCDHLRRLATGFENIVYDINQIKERDPAALNAAEVVFLYSGFHALAFHRAAHLLHVKGLPMTARALSQFAKLLTGIEIHPGATIGRGLFIDHGTGVVIGETAVIGDNCTIYQGVTLGGTGKHTGKRHPTLGDNVMIGAGAKVLGPFKIGNNSKIAAGAVVLEEIPENCTAVGIPAKVVICDGKRVEQDLDQVHIPDPVAQELADIQARLAALEAKKRRTRKKPEPAEQPAE